MDHYIDNIFHFLEPKATSKLVLSQQKEKLIMCSNALGVTLVHNCCSNDRDINSLSLSPQFRHVIRNETLHFTLHFPLWNTLSSNFQQSSG